LRPVISEKKTMMPNLHLDPDIERSGMEGFELSRDPLLHRRPVRWAEGLLVIARE
jgi:hypothetical protein